MSGELRFFKCNVLGGFRLSDLNKQVKQGEYFYVNTHIAETSRAVISSLKARWMIEVSEKEASKHINIPRMSPDILSKNGLREVNIGYKGAVNKSASVAIPNTKEVNQSLESRQTIANNLNQRENQTKNNVGIATPNIKEVDKKIRDRQEDTINKSGHVEVQQKDSGVVLPNFDEVKKNVKDDTSVNKMGASTDSELFNTNEQVATPDFKKTKKEEIIKDIVEKADEQIKEDKKIVVKKKTKKVAKDKIKKTKKVAKDKVKKIKKVAKDKVKKTRKKKRSIIKKDIEVDVLVDDSVFDKSVVTTNLEEPKIDEPVMSSPIINSSDLDEKKKEKIKGTVKADLENRIIQKKQIKRKVTTNSKEL